jgi:hypothetical protein
LPPALLRFRANRAGLEGDVNIRAIAAAAAVILVPIAVQGAGAEPERNSEYYTKKICQVFTPTGSRLGGVRRCRTQSEIDQVRRENRDDIDHIQALKVTLCGAPNGHAC